jgi:hypothetical protein
MINTKTAWLSYFTGNPALQQQKEYRIRQKPSDTNVYVLNCLFKSITSTSDGGALYCSSVTYLLIESSSFFSCNTSSSYGGAICFANAGSSQCVLHEVCGYDCCTIGGNHGQFAYITVSSSASSKNYVNYSSISRCVNEVSGSHFMLYLNSGKICCPSVNMSMNKCYYRTGIQCEPYLDSSSVTGSLTYSSFTDNNSTGYTVSMLWRTGAKFEMKCCNFLRNTQVVFSGPGTISTSGYVSVIDSCFLENKAKYIFYTYYSSTLVTISNCTIDSVSYYGSFAIQSTVTKSFIHSLNHMSTQNCHSEYDSVGTLTPNIQQSSKKQKLYFSCPRNISLPLQLIFISLTNLFIFNFIHSGSLCDPLY